MEENETPFSPEAPSDAVGEGQAPLYDGQVFPPQTPLYGVSDVTVTERKAIRKTANTVGFTLLVTELAFSFWSVGYLWVTGRLGMTRETAVSLVNNPVMLQVLQIALTTVAFWFPAVLIFKLRGSRIGETVMLAAPKKGTVLPMFLFGMAFCMFANISTAILQQFFKNFGIDYHLPRTEDPTGVLGICLVLLANCFFPAFVEEFVFRGLVLGSLKQYGEGFAVLASSILFGLIHGNFEQIPFAFLVGLVLGFIAVQTGSLWVGMAVHAANNFVSVLFSYFLKDIPNEAANLIYLVLLLVIFALGIAALLLTGKHANGFPFQKAETQAAEKTKHKWFFLSPCVLLIVAFCLYNAFKSL